MSIVDAAVFDVEYTRWLEEHHRLTCELRAAVQEHLPENELRLFVDNCLAQYDEVMSLKAMVAKSDVFHLVSGMWKTPAERCFIWIGDFRPSDLIKVTQTPSFFFIYINLNEIFSKFLANYKQNMTLITWSVTRKWHALINWKLGQDFTRQALRNSWFHVITI